MNLDVRDRHFDSEIKVNFNRSSQFQYKMAATREILKHMAGGFILHGVLIFASTVLLSLFLPDAWIKLPLTNYKQIFLFSGVSGSMAGLIGAIRAFAGLDDTEADLLAVPKTVNKIVNRFRRDIWESNGKKYVVSQRLGLCIEEPSHWKYYFLI